MKRAILGLSIAAAVASFGLTMAPARAVPISPGVIDDVASGSNLAEPTRYVCWWKHRRKVCVWTHPRRHWWRRHHRHHRW
jgi:hypothetical protein